MSFELWMGPEEFQHTGERRALVELVRQMVSRFEDAPETYVLLADVPRFERTQIDLLLLKRHGILLIELKSTSCDDGVLHGTEHGDWWIEYEGSTHELNEDRWNPYEQVKGQRKALSQLLASRLAGRLGGLNEELIAGLVAIHPGFDEARSAEHITLSRDVKRWFRPVGLRRLMDEVFAYRNEYLSLEVTDMQAIARVLGTQQRTYFADISGLGSLVIPRPEIFSRPVLPRVHLDRVHEMGQLTDAFLDERYPILVIGGLGGCGKTHLAAKLTGELGDLYQLCWVDCGRHGGLGLETVLLRLASDMQREQPDWAQMVADPSVPEPLRIDAALDYLDARRVCLVFDDFHVIPSTSGLDRLILRLTEIARHAKVIIVSRGRPDFLLCCPGWQELRVSGLPVEETLTYLRQMHGHLGLQLGEADRELIWEQTGGGMPRVLDLLAGMSRGKSPAEVARTLPVYGSQQGRQWFERLLGQVGSQARTVARAASVVRGEVTIDLLQAIVGRSGQVNATREVTELVDNYVLLPQAAGGYRLDDLVHAFLYGSLDERTRRDLHRRAGRHLAKVAETGPDEYTRLAVSVEALYHLACGESWSEVLERAPAVYDMATNAGESGQA